MRATKRVCIVALSLIMSACYYSRPPSIGWGYAVGNPILYERPLYPYYSSSSIFDYGNSYRNTTDLYTPTYGRINQTGLINVVDQ